MPMRNSVSTVVFAVLVALQAAPAFGQGDYPAKPVTLISPFGAGGSVEQEFRLYTQHILENTGKRFLIDARVGAGGTVGANYVAKATPDGYTLLAVSSAFAITPSVYPNLPYDNNRDFAPVSLLTKHVYLLVVNPNSPFRNAADYVAAARARPGELNFGTAGIGGATHLPGELLHYLTKTRVTFVHYKTPPQRVLDLVAGRIDAAMGSFTLMLPQVRTGKLRAAGVSSNQRVPLLADLPTLEEQGAPGYDFSSWVGLIAPAKTPPAVVSRLNALFAAAARDPEVFKKLEADGTIAVAGSPEQFRQFIAVETERWRKLFADTGLRLEQE